MIPALVKIHVRDGVLLHNSISYDRSGIHHEEKYIYIYIIDILVNKILHALHSYAATNSRHESLLQSTAGD